MPKHPKSAVARIGAAGKIALSLALPIVAGSFLGNYLDQQLGSAPWMTLLLLMLGVAAGFAWLYRLSTSDEDDE